MRRHLVLVPAQPGHVSTSTPMHQRRRFPCQQISTLIPASPAPEPLATIAAASATSSREYRPIGLGNCSLSRAAKLSKFRPDCRGSRAVARIVPPSARRASLHRTGDPGRSTHPFGGGSAAVRCGGAGPALADADKRAPAKMLRLIGDRSFIELIPSFCAPDWPTQKWVEINVLPVQSQLHS